MQFILTIAAYVVVVIAASAEAGGFEFTNQNKVVLAFACYAGSTLVYMLSVKLQKNVGINSSLIQNLLFFSATVLVVLLINLAMGKLSRWTIDMWFAVALATIAIGYLVAKTNS